MMLITSGVVGTSVSEPSQGKLAMTPTDAWLSHSYRTEFSL